MFQILRGRSNQGPSLGLLPADSGLSQEELTEWRTRQAELDLWWDWFDGTALEERSPTKPGKKEQGSELYPLRINPVKAASMLHSFALAGEVPDTADPIVKTMVEPNSDSEADKALAEAAQNALLGVEYQNDTRAMDMDLFLASQPLGASVLRVNYERDNPYLPSGIRYEYVAPRNFYCRWAGTDYWHLTEAWVWITVSQDTAKRLYGVDTQGKIGQFLEYWSPTNHWIKVDDQYAKRDDNSVINETHEFGCVPFVYVPHLRAAQFWGMSLVPDVIGLTKEYNARVADVGDAVTLAVGETLAMRNVKTGYPAPITLPDGRPAVNLGRSLGSGDPQPDLFRPAGAQLPASTEQFIEGLRGQVRQALQTPDVAYGEDEGSQRSGQTLYNRMWPMVAHVRAERTNWTIGRNLRAEIALKIMAAKKLVGITAKHLNQRKRQLWAPMLPVDRQQVADEVVKLMQEDGISLEHAVERLGSSTDVKVEVLQIWSDIEKKLMLEAKAKKAGTPDPAQVAPFGNRPKPAV
jgi:hypothetical protein